MINHKKTSSHNRRENRTIISSLAIFLRIGAGSNRRDFLSPAGKWEFSRVWISLSGSHLFRWFISGPEECALSNARSVINYHLTFLSFYLRVVSKRPVLCSYPGAQKPCLFFLFLWWIYYNFFLHFYFFFQLEG